MSWYNHFSNKDDLMYRKVCFGELQIGERFRMHIHRNKRTALIIMVKTSDLSCQEVKSKKDRKFYSSAFDVFRYEPKTNSLQ